MSFESAKEERFLGSVRVPILYYHRVEEHILPEKGVPPRLFEIQLEYLKRKGFHSVGFEDLADSHFKRNWTRGCIAVNNAEMDDLWRLVADGTPIVIKP